MGSQAPSATGALPAASVAMGPRAAASSGTLRAPVAVTGMGAVTSFGDGTAALWRALAEGADGIAPITRFSTAGFSVQNAAMVPDGASAARKTEELALDFAIRAAREAVRSARLEPANLLTRDGAASGPKPRAPAEPFSATPARIA